MSVKPILLYEERTETEFRKVTLEPEPDGLRIFCHDIGDTAERIFGNRELERWTRVPLRHLGKLAYYLIAERLSGAMDADQELKAICEKYAIEYESDVWV